MICDSSASGSGQPARRGLSRKKAETAACCDSSLAPGSSKTSPVRGEHRHAEPPVCRREPTSICRGRRTQTGGRGLGRVRRAGQPPPRGGRGQGDRKSTRLNSSHGYISYAVLCLKKKK